MYFYNSVQGKVILNIIPKGGTMKELNRFDYTKKECIYKGTIVKLDMTVVKTTCNV